MNRPQNPILTEWETKLLRILWNIKKGSASQIREILWEQDIRRSDSAIRKTLRVMEKKGAITHSEEDRTYVYQPLIEKNQVEQRGIKYISNILFEGSVGKMMLRAMDEADLSPEVVKELRKRLDEFES